MDKMQEAFASRDWFAGYNAGKAALQSQQPAWIPCAERLPRENKPYLVFANDIVSSWVEVVNSYTCPEYGNHVWENRADGEDYAPIVTHWMELPAPPEVE